MRRFCLKEPQAQIRHLSSTMLGTQAVPLMLEADDVEPDRHRRPKWLISSLALTILRLKFVETFT